MAKKKKAQKSKKSEPVRQVAVKSVPTNELRANPHNPRALFDKEPLDTLRESIDRVGILVPLTVYYDTKRECYTILDGQRRWMCSKELELDKVPVNVVSEPSLIENIVTMFQIHKLREDWELMPTALKLELLMTKLNERNEARLATLTGLDQAVVVRCKKLLDYPKKYQDLMLDPDPKMRIKADFFIELYAVRNDRVVRSFEWFTPDKFTKAMLDRYKEGRFTDGPVRLKSVTDFRKIKQYISHAKSAKKEKTLEKRLKEFTNNIDLDLDHLEISSATVAAEAKSMGKIATKLIRELENIEVDEFVGEEDLWDSLEKLRTTVTKKLREVGRRIR